MRHAQDQLGDVEPRRLLDDGIEQRHERLAALEREALLPGISRLEKLLERLGGHQTLEDRVAVVGGELGMIAARLDTLLQPFAARLVRHRQVFDAERAAVRFAEGGDQVAQRSARAALEGRPVHDAVEIALGEAELRQPQQRMLARTATERVEIGHQMAELTIGVHELVDRAAGAHTITQGEVEAGEDERPALVDRGGIAKVLTIEGVDVFGIGARDLVEGQHPSAYTLRRRGKPRPRWFSPSRAWRAAAAA